MDLKIIPSMYKLVILIINWLTLTAMSLYCSKTEPQGKNNFKIFLEMN